MATKEFKGTEINCTRCGGDVKAVEFETGKTYICLVLCCKQCNTIIDKTWKKKQSKETDATE
jgi:hypothetical protein